MSLTSFKVNTLIFKNSTIDFSQLVKLVQSGLLQKVTNWEFIQTNICQKIITSIFANKYTAVASSLKIDLGRDNNGLLQVILKTKKLQGLKQLSFINANICKETLAEFGKHPIIQNLEHLDLSKNFLVPEVAENFFKTLNAPKLTHLNLHHCHLNSSLVTQIFGNSTLANLKSVNFNFNIGISEGVKTFATSKYIKNLE